MSSEPSKFRKKPVVIEAMQWHGNEMHDNQEVLGWLNEHSVQYRVSSMNEVVLPTLEGDMTASRGDWIIRGVAGEFYPCKPDIFDATYEPIDTPPGAP